MYLFYIDAKESCEKVLTGLGPSLLEKGWGTKEPLHIEKICVSWNGKIDRYKALLSERERSATKVSVLFFLLVPLLLFVKIKRNLFLPKMSHQHPDLA